MTEPLPPDLIDYEHALTQAIRRHLDARRERRRRVLVPAAVCGAAAVVAAGVGAVGLTSSSGGLGPPVAQAAVLRGAVRALDAPAGTILHVVATDTNQNPSGPASTDTRELWMLPVPVGTPCNVRQDCPALYQRTVYQSASGEVDSSTAPDDRTDLYDASTNTIDEPPSLAASWQSPEPFDPQNASALNPFGTEFATQLQQAINVGRAHVIGDTTVDGQSVIEIAGSTVECHDALANVSPSQAQGNPACQELATWTYDVTPGTYRPVQLQSIGPSLNNTIAFQTWETLPAAQNMSVFDLAAQHPGARVDTSAADYQTAAKNANSTEGVPALATVTALPGSRPSSARTLKLTTRTAASRQRH